MERRDKVKIAFTVVSLVAITVFFTTRCRRKQRRKRSSCYLQDDPKPQYTFKRVCSDNSYSPFEHLILDDSHNDNKSNSHPYEVEITSLLENPLLDFNFISGSKDFKMSETYVWVDTESQLEKLANMLSREKTFAVDTEQHSLRSFLGFTALIQISTQKEDYLVDTISLHDSMGLLRPVFANGSICKVFHGADNDVIWLQRDFRIYIVNLFDTAKACEVLSKPQKSLAYLLETYCGVATNKLLQREDWRQRPLSIEMVEYARTDAHYLIYISNCLLSELKQGDNEDSCPDDKFRFVLEASRRSNIICLQLYTKEIEAFPGESAALSISSRHWNGQGGGSSVPFQTQFQDTVRRLCAWRDLTARVHDESLRYVLSDQAIAALADQSATTATEIQRIIAQADMNMDLSLTPYLPSPSPVVCCHLDDLSYLLQDKICEFDTIFTTVLQKCLGPNGSCPLSIFNYALLNNYNMRTMTLVSKDSKQYGIRKAKQVSKKASRELFVKKFSCKSPVYHNCRIYANDGRLLCYCDRRKLEWYLQRDLAELVDDDPPAIRLLFEPKGRPEDEDNEFYIQSKRNICVGCGEGNHYLRYRIIPSCYRMHFPEHLKSHRSHDIVLLCVDCHEVAHAAAEKHKRHIAAEFGIPLFVRKVVYPREAHVLGSSDTETNFQEAGVSPLQLRTAAIALIRHGPRMPSERREELKEIVRRYYGGREISDEDLERALLVGMNPHERRRLEKKRGLSLKNYKQTILSDAEQQNNTFIADTSCIMESLVPTPCGSDITNSNAVNGNDRALSMEKSRFQPTEEDSDLGNDSFCSKTKLGDGDVSVLNVGGNRENGSSLGRVDVTPESNGTAQPKFNPKLSLLGHGPHGKQVVDHLLEEYGEEGIGKFCQRWRQVFVEAVNPRFLPGGWQVNHSGRRDFGEFSVYNPTKKASGAKA